MLLGFRQRGQKRSNGRNSFFQQLLSNSMSTRAEMERYGALVVTFAPLDQPVSDQSVDETHSTWVRQTQNAAQLIVRWPGSMPDHHKRCRGFAGTVENVACGRSHAIRDGQPNGSKQVRCSI